MNRKYRIKNLISNLSKDFTIEIVDNSHLHVGHNNFDGENETHIKIILDNKNNVKINRLNIHKQINDLLKYEFRKGLHSLEIKII